MRSQQNGTFDAQAFLDSTGIARKTVAYRRAEVIFTQGDPCRHVLYIQKGAAKLSVRSKAGRQVVVARLGAGEFLGEEVLVGQSVRMGSATATTNSTILLVEKDQMVRVLREKHAMSDRFIANVLERHIRIEEQLINQLFSSNEKQLARALVLLAGYGRHEGRIAVPPISQDAVAKLTGMPSSRVNGLMKKFQQLGFVDRRDGLKVNDSLLTVIL
jgi:CRP/FNR family cyclic AMP-dependent transcriptional regulator